MDGKSDSLDYVARVTVLDAKYLDYEAYSLIKTQLTNVVKYIGQGILTKFEPEIDTFIRYTLLYYTVQKTHQSIGQQLLQVKYKDSISVKWFQRYIITLCAGRWISRRIKDLSKPFISQNQTKYGVEKTLNRIEICFSIFEVLNLLTFLWQGYYPSFMERIFGLQPTSIKSGSSRKISYIYFTRELLWHGFAELISFVLPLINVQRFHSIIRQILPSSALENEIEDDDVNLQLQTTCILCNKKPILPHCFGCEHMMCYYCVYSQYTIGLSFSCPLCGYTIESKSQIVPVRNKRPDV